MKMDNSVKIEKWAVAVMLVLGVLFYFVPGEWVSIESDSLAYLEARGREGVLPGYPIFLAFFKNILGEQYFLNGVVVAQSILAIICTFIFVMVLQKQFALKGGECILLYVATMLPFSIYLPESGITHQIMTEGLAYAIFYLYFITIMKGVWTLKLRWYFAGLFMALVLGLIRSQMLFLQATCFLLLFWIIFRKYKKNFWKKLLCLFGIVILGICVAFLSYKAIYAVVAYDNQRTADRIMAEMEAAVENEDVKKQNELEEAEYTILTADDEMMTSQFDSLIISRGFFEADAEDVELFDDEIVRDIFIRTYELANEGKHLYNYAKPGLYMWRSLVYDRMGMLVDQAIDECDTKYPGIREKSKLDISREMGIKLLLTHFDRYLYHTMRLMIPSFIASVFFQIESIYLLCHCVTLLIYLFAILGAIWVAKVRKNRSVAEFSLAIVIMLIVMVVIINFVFIGLQRYVVYGMGIFYCAMYLQVKEIYLEIKDRLTKEK